MSANLKGLDYNTTYHYVAFVTTEENETFYGEEQTFTTGEDVTGIEDVEQEELRQRSHRPQDFYGQAHFMPEVSDGAAVLWLNRARCAARNAELAAVHAFADREGNPTRVDILQALNRMSSMLYILMIQVKAHGR